MKLSVIIPVFNEERFIISCLKSLDKQIYGNFEVIVVDDGSTDKTFNLLSNFASQRYRLSVLKQNHKGPGAARNYGAKLASGETLVFVDADMVFDNKFLTNLVKPIEEGRTIGTFSKEEYLANKDNVWARCWNLNRGLPRDRMHNQGYPNTQKVFRAILKAEFIRVGGFNERAGYTDDWSLSEKLDKEAINAPGAVFYHFNPASLSEVYRQSKWMAKRKYKLGLIGNLVAVVRVSLPVSIFNGVLKAIASSCLQFLLFKVVSDFGILAGLVEYLFLGKVDR